MELGEEFDYKNAESVLRKAIGFYGEQAQLLTAREELGELIQAISKYNIDNEAIIQRIKEKIERLAARLEAMEAKP
jgi:hypothetical protein